MFTYRIDLDERFVFFFIGWKTFNCVRYNRISVQEMRIWYVQRSVCNKNVVTMRFPNLIQSTGWRRRVGKDNDSQEVWNWWTEWIVWKACRLLFESEFDHNFDTRTIPLFKLVQRLFFENNVIFFRRILSQNFQFSVMKQFRNVLTSAPCDARSKNNSFWEHSYYSRMILFIFENQFWKKYGPICSQFGLIYENAFLLKY